MTCGIWSVRSGGSITPHDSEGINNYPPPPVPAAPGIGEPYRSEEMIALCRWWSKAAGRGCDETEHFECSVWDVGVERPTVGGVSIKVRNGAPSRKGCVWQVVNWLWQETNEYTPPTNLPPLRQSSSSVDVAVLRFVSKA